MRRRRAATGPGPSSHTSPVPQLLPGTGLVCDLGPGPVAARRRRIALRADLDGLPLPDTCGEPWQSTVPGVAHACGHDVHTAVVLGAGLVLAELAEAGLLQAGEQPGEVLAAEGLL